MHYYYTKSGGAIEQFYEEHFSKDLLYKKEVSLVFYNTHASIVSRPFNAKVIEVGGIHVKPAKPLPEVGELFFFLFFFFSQMIIT